MSNLSQMLSKPLDNLDDAVVPEGTWRGKIKGGKIGDVRVSEAGDEYQRVSVALKLEAPGHDVNPSDEPEKFVGETVFFEAYIKGERDVKQLLRTLQGIGVQFELGGAPLDVLETALQSAKGTEINAEVTQETYQNKPRTKVKKIYALV